MQGPNPPEEIKNPIHLTFWGLKTRRDIYRGVGPCYDPLKDIVLPPVQKCWEPRPCELCGGGHVKGMVFSTPS
eukprot:7409152-Pyramimonas_sp.AAC.1